MDLPNSMSNCKVVPKVTNPVQQNPSKPNSCSHNQEIGCHLWNSTVHCFSRKAGHWRLWSLRVINSTLHL